LSRKKNAFSHHSDYNKFKHAITQLGERPPVNDLHPALSEFLVRCWSANPVERPTFAELVPQLDKLILKMFVDDASGRDFWSGNFGSNIKVEWDEFLNRLLEYSGKSLAFPKGLKKLPVKPTSAELQTSNDDQKREFGLRSIESLKRVVTETHPGFFTPQDQLIASLKLVFVPHHKEEFVPLDHYGSVLAWLGPFDKEMIDRFQNLTESAWFHGYLSKLDAETRLRAEAPGTFLVRFSTTHQGSYAISKKGEKNKYIHVLIKHQPWSYFYENRSFQSLQDLINTLIREQELTTHCSGSIFQTLLEPDNPYEDQ